MAGILGGLAVSFKYPGVIALVSVLTAHFLRVGRSGLRDPNLYFALALVPVTFIAANPYAVLDYPQLLKDAVFEVEYYSTGHPGMEGNSLVWYLTYAWQTEGPVVVVAVVGMLRAFVLRNKHRILLLSFPVTYFAFISFFTVRNDRTFLPAVPFLVVFGAMVIGEAWRAEGRILRAFPFTSGRTVGVFELLVGLGIPLANSLTAGAQLQKTDERQIGNVWLEHNIPEGSKIGLKSYASFVSPDLYEVYGFSEIIDHDPQWYVDESYDYLVLSERYFARYYRSPGKYVEQTEAYESFFSRFVLLTSISTGGPRVLVYQVAP